MGSIFQRKEAKREAGNWDRDDAESTDSVSSMQVMAERLKRRDPRKELALKAGFVSLQERLGNWARQASVSPTKNRPLSTARATVPSPSSDEQRCHQHQQTGQFATLQEFFQSKSSLRKQLEQDELLRKQRRPRVPIMKLTKEDWNVKCWEERFSKTKSLSSGQASKENNDSNRREAVQPNRAIKLDRQVEVFHGRIDEVAKKLEKVREGAPLDEQLSKLKGNKLRETKREHTWTDMLKSELTEGAHNPKLLKSKLQSKLGDTTEDGVDSESIASTTTTAATARRRLIKSPLGRPIGRIDQDDDDDDDGVASIVRYSYSRSPQAK